MGIKGFRAWFESQFPNAITTMTDRNKVSESFDHVLVDMNQLLHICLRKSRSDGHAMTLLMKELDLVCTMARPTKSLVLAMDGPPSAAKLATQRQRRFGTLARFQARFQLMNTFSSRFSLREQTRRKRYYAIETKTLCITPGTDFMRLAEQAILYWAWQRLSNPRQSISGVQIYLSTSLVPGEGEVKLLDWIVQYQNKAIKRYDHQKFSSTSKSSTPSFANHHHHHYHQRPKSAYTTPTTTISNTGQPTCPLMDESYAILGGDSDLVLEALVVQATNVFVLLPDGKDRYLSVSLWETSKTLHALLAKNNNTSGGRPAKPSRAANEASAAATTLSSVGYSNSTIPTPPSTSSPLLHPWQDTLLRIRTDLVLLLILNGNDYLPRIRGSSGFNKLFHTYFRLLRQWKTDVLPSQSNTTNTWQREPSNQTSSSNSTSSRRRRGRPKKSHTYSEGEPFLVNPTTLEFNLPFCITFFQHLVQMAPPAHLMAKSNEERAAEVAKGRQRTALSQLNNLVDAGFLPSPIRWKIIRPSEDDDSDINNYLSQKEETTSRLEAEMNKNDDYEDEETGAIGEIGLLSSVVVNGPGPMEQTVSEKSDDDEDGSDDDDGEQVLVRLLLGDEGTEDYCSYEAWHTMDSPLKDTKHEIARMALEDQLGSEFSNLVDDNDNDDDEDNWGIITNSGYAWEISHSMPGKVDKYLAGLLWNLQTYQDGICSDYSYNYGRRLAPTANEIVHFLELALKEGRKIDRRELLGDKFEPSINAGLASLAALPSQVKELVPLPYRNLATDDVEEIYGACMDPEDNAFDIRKFELLANEKVSKLQELETIKANEQPAPASVDLKTGVVNGFKPSSQHGSGKVNLGERQLKKGGSFRMTIDNQIEKIKQAHETDPSGIGQGDSNIKPKMGDRKIVTGDSYWTVLSRTKAPLSNPFLPPAPFTERLAMLWPSNRVRVSRSFATWAPRQLYDEDCQPADNGSEKSGGMPKENIEREKRWSTKLQDYDSILEVPYKKAYIRDGKHNTHKKSKQIEDHERIHITAEEQPIIPQPTTNNKNQNVDIDVAKRMRDFHLEFPPKDAPTTLDGHPFTALACLKQLEDLGWIGALEWATTLPSPSEYASFKPNDHEWIEITIKPGPNPSKSILEHPFTLGQDRHVNTVSRQILKQHLASMALQKLKGPGLPWSSFTINELKSHFIKEKSHVSLNITAPPSDHLTTVDGITAISCLKQLKDSGVIAFRWTTTMPSTSSYASFNPSNHELVELSISPAHDLSKSWVKQPVIYEQDRDVNSTSRQIVKHQLASLALRDLLGPGRRKWHEYSFEEFKDLCEQHVVDLHHTGTQHLS